jgi:hypothetical protein
MNWLSYPEGKSMRVRLLALAVVLALPGLSGAQRIPVRPPPRMPLPEQPPKEPPVVAREMNYRRLRWSSESFAISSVTYLPSPTGTMTRYANVGTGAHHEYRLGMANRFAMTFDVAGTSVGDPLTMMSTELGGRFYSRPQPDGVRFYSDARLGYFATMNGEMSGTSTNLTVPRSGYTMYQQSRGFGAVAGVGAEVPVSLRFSLYGGLSGMRSRMTIFGYDDLDRRSNLLDLLMPGSEQGRLWATSYRLQLGFRYNPVRFLRLEQNPMK